jgi:hypothetical protein
MNKTDTRRSLLQALKDLLRRIRRRKPQSPGDPADILVPLRRGPKGRSGAAVAEPEDDSYRLFPPRRQ